MCAESLRSVQTQIVHLCHYAHFEEGQINRRVKIGRISLFEETGSVLEMQMVSGVLINYSEKVMISSVAGLRSNKVNRYPLLRGSCMDQFSKWRSKEPEFYFSTYLTIISHFQDFIH